MNILSLDLSTKSSGWCVSINNKLIDYGCIQSSSTNAVKRIFIMKDNIKEIIKKYNIEQIIIEEVRTDYQNNHTYKILTWLQAAIVFATYEINPEIQIEYMQASSWRSKIGIHTGRGIKRNTLKQEDIKYVKNKYNIDANDDICDSICLLDAYIIDQEEEEKKTSWGK